MKAIHLIAEDIPPLTHIDTAERALSWMDEFKVSHLPVLKNADFVGVVSETDILDKMEMAYTFYLRTSRLDLDDYNKEVEEGCHITSMAGTWMSIVEGFGGMRVKNHALHFAPKIPKEWNGYSFKINFRNQILKVTINQSETKFSLEGNQSISVFVNGKEVVVEPNNLITV